MNRRTFLKLLGITAAAPAVAKEALQTPPPAPKLVPYRLPPQPAGWYSGYDILPCAKDTIVALTPEELAAIEDKISKAEKELGRKLAEEFYKPNPYLGKIL